MSSVRTRNDLKENQGVPGLQKNEAKNLAPVLHKRQAKKTVGRKPSLRKERFANGFDGIRDACRTPKATESFQLRR